MSLLCYPQIMNNISGNPQKLIQKYNTHKIEEFPEYYINLFIIFSKYR